MIFYIFYDKRHQQTEHRIRHIANASPQAGNICDMKTVFYTSLFLLTFCYKSSVAPGRTFNEYPQIGVAAMLAEESANQLLKLSTLIEVSIA
jgi:hypothetical protein